MKSQYLQSKERKPGTLTGWEIMARQGRGKPIQNIEGKESDSNQDVPCTD